MNCSNCSGPVSAVSKSGLCRSCFTRNMNADPEFQARRAERIRQKMADPMHRAKMAATVKRNFAKWRETAAGREWLETNGKRLATEVLRRSEVVAKAVAPEARSRATRTKREKAFGWFPPNRTDQFIFLTKRKKLTGAEAVRVIRAEIAAERERAEARLSPFERQMLALENGAKLIANDPRPSGNQVVRRVG